MADLLSLILFWVIWRELTESHTTGLKIRYTLKPVCNDHLYDKIYYCDLFSNVF